MREITQEKSYTYQFLRLHKEDIKFIIDTVIKAFPDNRDLYIFIDNYGIDNIKEIDEFNLYTTRSFSIRVSYLMSLNITNLYASLTIHDSKDSHLLGVASMINDRMLKRIPFYSFLFHRATFYVLLVIPYIALYLFREMHYITWTATLIIDAIVLIYIIIYLYLSNNKCVIFLKENPLFSHETWLKERSNILSAIVGAIVSFILTYLLKK